MTIKQKALPTFYTKINECPKNVVHFSACAQLDFIKRQEYVLLNVLHSLVVLNGEINVKTGNTSLKACIDNAL